MINTPTPPPLVPPAARPRAMLLAAGLGTRLRPLTDRRPKPLLPLLNQPILTYNLLLLARAGVREVVINLHHEGAALADALGDGAALGLRLRYSVEEELLGTGGGIRRALPWLAEQGSFLVVNGDTLIDADLAAAHRRHRERGAIGTLLLHHHADAPAYGAIGMMADRRVTGIGPLLGPRPQTSWLFAGAHILEPELVERLPSGEASCIIRQGYVPAIRAGEPVLGDPAVTFWADLGTPATYLAGHWHLLDAPGTCAHQPRPALPSDLPTRLRVIPPAVVGAGVRCDGDATVGPYAVLGEGVRLDPGVRVERSVVWAGARVRSHRVGGVLTAEGVWVEG